MARIRTVKPELFKHEALFDAEAETGLPLRLAFIALWTACDREGRFRWRPRSLKSDCLPFDEIDFSRVLDALMTRGFVVRYEVSGDVFGCIPSWSRHQYINNREVASELPAPPQATEKHNDLTRASRVDDASPARQRNARVEGEREREEEEERILPPPPVHYPASDAPAEAGGGGSGLVNPTLRERILTACGADPISGMTGPTGRRLGTQADMAEVARWQAAGLTDDEIVAEVTATMANKRDGPPSSLKFFASPMARLAGAKSAPPLSPIIPAAGGTGPPVADLDAIFAAVKARRGAVQ